VTKCHTHIYLSSFFSIHVRCLLCSPRVSTLTSNMKLTCGNLTSELIFTHSIPYFSLQLIFCEHKRKKDNTLKTSHISNFCPDPGIHKLKISVIDIKIQILNMHSEILGICQTSDDSEYKISS
jgi:hypothetical protein